MMMLDSQEFYRKWIRDILDCQDKTTGHVQHTAPLMGGGGGPGGWGCAIVIVPYQYYKMYGDTAMLETCYEPMRRWVDYLKAHSEKGLVVREEERGWCLGDWCPLEEPILLPEAYVNSCYFIKILQMLENIAPVVNRSEDAAEYAALRESIAASIRRDYFDPETGTYLNNIQGADAYALWAGLAGSDTARDMALRYDKLGHFDTGFLGTDILMEMLCKYGHIDTALKLLESEEPGSYLYMKRCGATTIWENWGRGNSENHPMFGACVRQLFSSILGIGQEDGAAGYRQLRIAPQIPKDLPRASGSLRLPAGETAVAWKKEAGKIHFHISIPQNITATFVYGGNEYPLTETDNNFTFAIE
jgi:alpha-L-rhamnosidase